MDADSSTKFIGSLTKFLQSLCNGYVEFQRGVELVGHIYLNIDTGEKVDYVLHEKVSKNDENSVTFVSNSFHAQPLDQDKDNKDMSSKSGATTRKGKSISSDDDDIMIVDQSKRVLDSSNSGSFPSRGVKRIGSPISSERHVQRMRSSGSLSSHSRTSSNFHQNNRQHPGPSATVTSQSQRQQGGLSISDVKLEQISKDELASLSSQVGEGSSRPQQGASSTGHSPHSEVWVKQERADDDEGDNEIGWSQGRDDSNSNSGSNLYPVMLHQNPTYPSAAFSGFPGASSSDPGANPYADPMPGSSQDSGGLDPSEEEGTPKSSKRAPKRKPDTTNRSYNRKSADRRYRERLKQDPVRYQRYREQNNQVHKRRRERKRQQQLLQEQQQQQQTLHVVAGTPLQQQLQWSPQSAVRTRLQLQQQGQQQPPLNAAGTSFQQQGQQQPPLNAAEASFEQQGQQQPPQNAAGTSFEQQGQNPPLSVLASITGQQFLISVNQQGPSPVKVKEEPPDDYNSFSGYNPFSRTPHS